MSKSIYQMAIYSIDRVKNHPGIARLATDAIMLELYGRGGFKAVMNDIRNDEDGKETMREIENVIAEIINQCICLNEYCEDCDKRKLNCICEKN